MDWTNKNVNPNKVVHIGQEVEVMILDIDEERRRISLGMKSASRIRGKSSRRTTRRAIAVKGQIKSITDFGIFIGLEGGIDGLVHLSDLDWNEAGEVAVRKYQKGQEVEPRCWRSTARASASRWASSSWPRIRSRSTWLSTQGQHRQRHGQEGDIRGAEITWRRRGGLHQGLRPRARPGRDATKILKEGDTLESRFIASIARTGSCSLS